MKIEELSLKIDGLFADWDSTQTPGCALAVIKNGEIIYKRGYGMASLEFGVPINAKTIFQIGSISKQFTAMAIAILATEGKISLDDDIRKHIPEVPDFGETITIRHLVHHTSGLRGIDELLLLAGNRWDDVNLLEDNIVFLKRQRALNFKPGEKHLYCNTGYTLMALIVERVSGQTMHAFCNEHLFQPMGMHDTIFHDDYKMVVPRFAQSYGPNGPGQYVKEYLMHGLPGSTSLLTTVEDLLYWDREFYTGGVVDKAVIDLMHQQGILNDGEEIDYAFGISIAKYRGLKTVSHGGSDAGYRAMLLRFPEQQFTVVVLSNLSSFSPDGAARKVADLCLKEHFTEEPTVKAPTPTEPVSLSEEGLADIAGLYYNLESEMGVSYKFTVRDGKLIIDLGPGFELMPLAEDLFSIAAFDALKMKFKRDSNGKKQMIILAAGLEIFYDEAEAAEPTCEELDTLAGDYYSVEMDVTYPIVKREDKLFVTMKKYGEIPLQPTIQNGFSLDLSQLAGHRKH